MNQLMKYQAQIYLQKYVPSERSASNIKQKRTSFTTQLMKYKVRTSERSPIFVPPYVAIFHFPQFIKLNFYKNTSHRKES